MNLRFFKRIVALATLCLLINALWAEENQKVLVTSHNMNYQIALQIKRRKLHIAVPDNQFFYKYMVGVKQPYYMDGQSEETPDYNPYKAPWIVRTTSCEGLGTSLSLRGLEDGMYEVSIYNLVKGGKTYWNYTKLYNIPIKVKGREITFVNSPHLQYNQSVLERIPTDTLFLSKCLAPVENTKVKESFFKEQADKLHLSSLTPSVAVQTVVDWVARTVYLRKGSGTFKFSELDAYDIVQSGHGPEYGVGLVGRALLRAAGIPTIMMQSVGLRTNSPWWIAPKATTFKQSTLLSFYDGKWHIITPSANINGRYSRGARTIARGQHIIGHRGVDVSLPYYSNRYKLLYEGDVKYFVENHLRPIDWRSVEVAAMPVDSIDALDKRTHLVTTYCRPLSITLDIQDSIVSFNHVPCDSTLTSWSVVWKDYKFERKVSTEGTLYDNAQWNIASWTPGTYFFNLYNKRRKGYAGSYKLPMCIASDSTHFIPAKYLVHNKKVMHRCAMDSCIQQKYLIHNNLYNPEDSTIIALAHEITDSIATDYAKIYAINKWVSSHIYYDKDAYEAKKYSWAMNMPEEVLRTKRAVCSGYTYLTCSLLRVLGIPAVGMRCYTKKMEEAPDKSAKLKQQDIRIYEQGFTGKHVFPIVYCENRWILMDPTWDSLNEFRFGEFQVIPGQSFMSNYFDATLDYLSQTRKFRGVQPGSLAGVSCAMFP